MYSGRKPDYQERIWKGHIWLLFHGSATTLSSEAPGPNYWFICIFCTLKSNTLVRLCYGWFGWSIKPVWPIHLMDSQRSPNRPPNSLWRARPQRCLFSMVKDTDGTTDHRTSMTRITQSTMSGKLVTGENSSFLSHRILWTSNDIVLKWKSKYSWDKFTQK